MDHQEIQEQIDRISRLEARQAELAAMFDLLAEKSVEVDVEMAKEIERLRKLRESG